MSEQNTNNYTRIAEAIEFIHANFKNQPTLEQIAEKINLSPFHFQRLFSDWAGTSPKNFLQFVSINHAKNLLKEKKATLFDVSDETGFSSTSRLHDLFIKLEGMSPGEYKNGGSDLQINYSFSNSIFGQIIVASTPKGICYLAFEENQEIAFQQLKMKFPNAHFNLRSDKFQENGLSIFQSDWTNLPEIKLHLKGTDFQLKVWESLLNIPISNLSTYGKLAKEVNSPNASRAVGTAIGSNPVAFIIPCHRVIQSTGGLGGYMWGTTRKAAIIGWEQAHFNMKK